MEKNTEFLEKLVHINRITKVVKGKKIWIFSISCCWKSKWQDWHCTC